DHQGHQPGDGVARDPVAAETPQGPPQAPAEGLIRVTVQHVIAWKPGRARAIDEDDDPGEDDAENGNADQDLGEETQEIEGGVHHARFRNVFPAAQEWAEGSVNRVWAPSVRMETSSPRWQAGAVAP